jgi:hypothetical protein
MEVEGVCRLIVPWKSDSVAEAKVVKYTYDRDAKTRKSIADLWGKRETLDRNRVTKSFDRRLSGNHVLPGIKAKLRRWFLFLLNGGARNDSNQSLLHFFSCCSIGRQNTSATSRSVVSVPPNWVTTQQTSESGRAWTQQVLL